MSKSAGNPDHYEALVVSFFGSSNVGDLLIAREIRDLVAQYCDVSVMNYGPVPDVVGSLSDLVSQTSHTPSGSSSVRRAVSKSPAAARALHAVRSVRRGVHKQDQLVERVRRALRGKRLLVIGGGNMMFDLTATGRSWDFFDMYRETAHELDIPVFAMAIGIGPFSTSYQERMVVRALSQCDAVSLRDEQSLAIFQRRSQHRAYLTVDPAFNLPRLTRGLPETPMRICFNPMDPALIATHGHKRQEIVEAYCAVISSLQDAFDCRVSLFSTELRDYDIIEAMKGILDAGGHRVEIASISSLKDLVDLLSTASIVVGARMHSLITAYTQGLPVVGIVWQPKVSAFFEMIEQERACFPLSQLAKRSTEIVKAVEWQVEHGDSEARQRRLTALRARLEINETLLSGLLV